MTASELEASIGDDPSEAFALLSNDTRVDILKALAAADGDLGFSDLRRRVGLRDGGVFNYHLEKLRGQFVAKTDDGYRLTPEGERIATLLES